MPINPAFKSFSQELYISHSQIFKYCQCSLSYRFQYVEHRQQERISIALPFGTAIHSAIALYYLTLKNKGSVEPLETLCERFETCLELDLENTDVPMIFKKDLPDHKGAVEMGRGLLKVFHENIAQTVQTAQEIVGVELPLSATLYTDDGEPTDFKLAGILDLVLRDVKGEILVVDNKTAARPMAQSAAEQDNQMTAYSYLLATNKFVFPTSAVKCRFDVLRKLKKPKLEHVTTTRTAEQRKRFAKLANSVLAGIDAGIFIPQPSWMCSDCAFSDACKAW
jgi:putative RecB family exonuclease